MQQRELLVGEEKLRRLEMEEMRDKYIELNALRRGEMHPNKKLCKWWEVT